MSELDSEWLATVIGAALWIAIVCTLTAASLCYAEIIPAWYFGKAALVLCGMAWWLRTVQK